METTLFAGIVKRWSTKFYLRTSLKFAVKGTNTLCPNNVGHFMLKAKQAFSQSRLISFHESCKFGDGHGRVQFQEGSNSRQINLLSYFFQENCFLDVKWLLVWSRSCTIL